MKLFRNHDRKHTASQRRRGLPTVEVAIITPLLILMTFGLLEYGWMFLKYGEVSNAARHGARIAARPQTNVADVQAQIATLMTQANLDGSGYTVAFDPADIDQPATTLISVTITVPYESIELTNIPIIPRPTRLTQTITMAKEGPE